MKNLTIIVKRYYSNYGQRVIAYGTDGIWSTGAVFVDRGAAFLVTVVIARTLGIEALGLFGLTIATCLIIINPLAYGFTMSVTKRIVENYRNFPEDALSDIIFMILVITGIVLLLGVPFLVFPKFVALKFMLNSDLFNLIRASYVFLVGELFRKYGLGLFNGFKAYKFQFISSIVFAILLVWTIPVSKNYGIEGVFLLYGLVNIGTFIFSVAILWRKYLATKVSLKHYQFKHMDIKLIAHYITPAIFSSLTPAIVIWYIQTLLVRYGDASHLGLFAATNQIKMSIVFLPAIFSTIMIPRIVSIKGEGKTSFRSQRIIIGFTLGITFLSVLVIGAILSIFSEPLANIYGSEFVRYVHVFKLMIWVGCLHGMNNSLGAIIMSRGSMWYGFMTNTIWAILLIVFSLLLIEDYLVEGLAYSFIASYLINTLIQITLAVRLTKDHNTFDSSGIAGDAVFRKI